MTHVFFSPPYAVGILSKAKGLAILTVFKAGFLVTARGGSGIVIAKTRDDLDYSEGNLTVIVFLGGGGGRDIILDADKEFQKNNISNYHLAVIFSCRLLLLIILLRI